MTLAEFLEVFFIASSPIVELRGAIPDAINHLHISWYFAFPVAVSGNLLPVLFLLVLLKPLSNIARKITIFENILDYIFRISRRRGGIIERHGLLGLVLFVAIPLPVTGAWTGSIVAFLLGIKFRYAFPAIALGVFIAGAIVTTFTLMGWYGAIAAGIGLAIIAILSLRKMW